MLPESATHLHLLSVIAELVRDRRGEVRVLDLGCGPGRLLQYLTAELPARCKGTLRLHGLDVSDHAPEGTAKLGKDARISIVRTRDRWPYPDGHFDVIFSNQVLEHVSDHHFVLDEIARTLKHDGTSVHLFPLRCYVFEGHVFLPFAHRMRAPRYIRLVSKVFRCPTERLPNPEMEIGEQVVRYLNRFTNYVTERDLRRLARQSGLSLTFSYTPRYYATKVRMLANRSQPSRYPARPILDYVSSLALRFVSSVTITLRHRVQRTPIDAIHRQA